MIPRFDRVERSLHWVNAALFLLLMATGAVLYIVRRSSRRPTSADSDPM